MVAADLEIVTTRLRLKAATLAVIEAVLHDRRRLAERLSAGVPEDWPPPDSVDFYRSVFDMVRDDPDLVSWGPWLMISVETQTLVGDAGFKGRPDREGIVEIGYSVVPAYQRRGLATEAVVGLIEWAFAHGARVVVAETDASNAASIRVLEKAGLRQVGQVGHMLNWRVEKD